MEYSSLPKDPMVLLSFINTKLRDDYPSLDELCSSLCVNADDINQIPSKQCAVSLIVRHKERPFWTAMPREASPRML